MANEKRLIDPTEYKAFLERYIKELHEVDAPMIAGAVERCLQKLEVQPTVDAVVLPCKVGDPVFVITYCRCGNPECYENRHCHKKETKRTPKVLASVMVQQKGKKYNWDKFTYERSWVWEPVGTICYRVFQRPFNVSMLPYIGTKVFLTLDEARKGVVLMSMVERREGE